MKISSNEKILLGAAVFLILAAVFYFYVFVPAETAYQTIKAEVDALKDEDTQLASGLKSETQYDASIKESQDTIKKYTDNFYTKTLQEQFIRKIQDMCFESGIKFDSTTYPVVDSPLSDKKSVGGVDVNAYLMTAFTARQAADTSEEAKAKSASEKAESAKKAATTNFAKFAKGIDLTEVKFRFKGTYAEVHKFVEIMEKNIKDDHRLVVSNTMKLSQIGKDKSANGIYTTYGFSLERPAWMLPEDKEQEYTVEIDIYFYMTNSLLNLTGEAPATQETPQAQKQ